MAGEIIEKELSYEIMKAAYEVHNELGPGFLESIYEDALAIELRAQGHPVETQVRIPVIYKGQKVGEHVLDHLVEGRVILELKAATEIAPIYKQQALSYLKATGLQLAIVINFGNTSVQSARVVNTKQKKLLNKPLA
jgi:GxxExxY protein